MAEFRDKPLTGDRAFQPTEPAGRRAARASFFALLGFVGLAALVPIARAALFAGHLPLIAPALLMADAIFCPLTGVGAWLVWRRVDVGLDRKRAALRRWGWLLMVSALWPDALTVAGSRPLAVACMVAAVAACLWTGRAFRHLRPVAALFLVPFGVWLGVITTVLIAHF